MLAHRNRTARIDRLWGQWFALGERRPGLIFFGATSDKRLGAPLAHYRSGMVAPCRILPEPWKQVPDQRSNEDQHEHGQKNLPKDVDSWQKAGKERNGQKAR